MPRVVSLWFPTLATDRLRSSQSGSSPDTSPPFQRGEQIIVTAAAEHGRRIVVACSAAARAAGLRPLMPLAEARVLIADLVVVEADPAGDATMLARIADHAARRWSPLAAIDPPDGLLLDITASAHLFGGEAALARIMRAAAHRAGLAVRLGIADSVGTAHALARFDRARLVVAPPGEDVVAIAPLPPAALRLEPAVTAAIARLGFATIADLLAAPRAPLIRRFGQAFGRRIEQALGRRAEPIDALVPHDRLSARRGLIEPIATAEAIAIVIQDLAGDLCEQLEQAGLGARRLLLVCRRVDARDEIVPVGFARPSRDASHIAELLRRRIEAIDPGLGIETMLLVAMRSGKLSAEQLGVPLKTPSSRRKPGFMDGGVPSGQAPAPNLLRPWVSAFAGMTGEGEPSNVIAFPISYPVPPRPPDPAEKPDLAILVDRLANRFGFAALHRAALAESDTPERMVARLPPLAPATARDWRADWPRPSRLLRRPEPLDNAIADMPDYAPAAFTWRGARYRVIAADGPERVCGEWWRGGALPHRVRDYFQVEVATGGRYWLFRTGDGVHPAAGPGDWYLHGAFG